MTDYPDYIGTAKKLLEQQKTINDQRHELANAQATVEMAMARIGELESQVQRQLAAAQELYRNSGVVKTAELLARVELLEADLLSANLTISMQSEQMDTDGILIQQLLGENARLREAARPLAENATAWTMNDEDRVLVWSRRGHADKALGDLKITVGDIIRLNEALNANP